MKENSTAHKLEQKPTVPALHIMQKTNEVKTPEQRAMSRYRQWSECGCIVFFI